MVQDDEYLKSLITSENNSNIKLVLGIHGVGKKRLLNVEYRQLLLGKGVREDQIINVDLGIDKKMLNASNLYEYLNDITRGLNDNFYIFINGAKSAEKCVKPGSSINIYKTLRTFASKKNINIYLTGFDKQSLEDMPETFRCGFETIQVFPLSFHEYYTATGGRVKQAFSDYVKYGGLPGILSCTSEDEKKKFLLEELEININDTQNNKKTLLSRRVLEDMARTAGTFTTAGKIAQRLKGTVPGVTQNTVREIVARIVNVQLFDKLLRYDLNRNKYLSSPQKFFCADTGLLNAMTGFDTCAASNAIENVIYNELKLRKLNVAMGTVYFWDTSKIGAKVRVHADVGLIAEGIHSSAHILYIDKISGQEEYYRTIRPLSLLKSSYSKILVRGDMDPGKGWLDENGIMNISTIDFLLDKKIIV